jgi:selenocysteine lyase/cysteine desulfurase
MAVHSGALDIEFVRRHFPAFDEPSLRGQAHFENAGGSYPCRFVIWRLHRFYRERKVQPYGSFAASRVAGAEMDEARERLARMMGVDAEEVHFGPSTTANTYTLANSFRRMLSPGDAIVVTDQDHEANSGPFRRLAEAGIEVREWRMDPETGHLDPAALAPLLDGPVRLVCFPHASNIVAEINPLARILAMVRAAGAISCVDGVSYSPHGLPDLGQLGTDIYLFSAYKTFGPHQGVMVVARAILDRLPNEGHGFNSGHPTARLTPAGPDHAQVAACAGIADYIDALYAGHLKAGRDARARAQVVHDMIRRREIQLVRPLLDYLATRRDLRLLGPIRAEARAPTLAIAHASRNGAEMAAQLARDGVMAGGGSFYANRALDALGIDPLRGVLRLSLLHYTTASEVDRAIAALDRLR